MPRVNQDYEKKLINFRTGDIEEIQKAFPNFAYSAIIRSLTEQFVDSIRQGKKPSIEFNPNKLEIK